MNIRTTLLVLIASSFFTTVSAQNVQVNTQINVIVLEPVYPQTSVGDMVREYTENHRPISEPNALDRALETSAARNATNATYTPIYGSRELENTVGVTTATSRSIHWFTTTVVKLRSEKSTSSTVYRILPVGTVVTPNIVNPTDPWVSVLMTTPRPDGRYQMGYVLKKYLRQQ